MPTQSAKAALRVVLIFLIPLIAYLLWPLKSDKFEIVWDENLINEKVEILNSIRDQKDGTESPNIILILADDLSKYDISLYNHPVVNTPNIDKLAKQGALFEQGYVSASICAPSRAGLITGRYQNRFGFENQSQERYLVNKLQYYGMDLFIDSYPWKINKMKAVPNEAARIKQGLPPSEITIAEALQAKGYKTALIGKWHLGSSQEQIPCEFGFDYQYGFYGSHSLFVPESTQGYVDQKNEKDWTDQYIWKGQRDGVHAVRRNCEIIKEGRYFTDAVAEESIQFIKETNDPFFLYLPFSAPHTPLQAADSDVALYAEVEDPIKRTYYAMIAALDRAVGNILDEVERQGKTENTLIFFLSDNGGATYTHTTDNGPLKGGKVTAFEGGTQVPFMMKWPGKISPNSVVHQPVTSLDIFQTCLSAAGISKAYNRKLDGLNLLNLITGEAEAFDKRDLFWRNGAVTTVLDYPYKLIYSENNDQSLMYKIDIDSSEKFNLITKKPVLFQQLRDKQKNWQEEMATPLWPPLITFYHKEDGEEYYFEN